MKKLMFSITAAIMCAASYVALRSNNSDREFTTLELANIEALTPPKGLPNIFPIGEVSIGCKEIGSLSCRVICNTPRCGQYYVAQTTK